MSVPQDQVQDTTEAQKVTNDKEYNFGQVRKQLEQEKMARQQAEQRAAGLERAIQERSKSQDEDDEDDDDSEPYIDKKRLQKTLNKIIPGVREEARKDVRAEVQKAIAQERQTVWLKSNPDFQEIMSHAQTFADKNPEEAETILEMPEGFERQKLVYHAIKRAGLHKKEEPKASIQDKVDANRRSPYYQPSGVSAAPYAAAGDFSPSGQKNAYAKMQELKNKLRI